MPFGYLDDMAGPLLDSIKRNCIWHSTTTFIAARGPVGLFLACELQLASVVASARSELSGKPTNEMVRRLIDLLGQVDRGGCF